MSTNPKKLAAEALTVADALRTLRAQIARAVHDTEWFVGLTFEVRAVMVDGLGVAIALQTIASHLAGKE